MPLASAWTTTAIICVPDSHAAPVVAMDAICSVGTWTRALRLDALLSLGTDELLIIPHCNSEQHLTAEVSRLARFKCNFFGSYRGMRLP